MELPKNIKDDIWEFCRLNDISAIDDFIVKMVKQGFTSEKFGSTPWDKEPEIKEVEKIVEKEVIIEKEVEVIKEVPVEVIKEIDKIIEVIKEIEVVKEVYVTNDTEVKKLTDLLESTKQDESIHKKAVFSLAKEKKELSDNLNDKTSEVNNLHKDLEIRKNEVSSLNLKVGRLNIEVEQISIELTSTKNELDEVKNQLEEELKKPKQVKEDDIYGENKKGFFGSNIKDIWKKNK